MNQTQTPSRVPDHHGEMLSYTLKSTGSSPQTKHSVIFQYPDCTRTFDGQNWVVTLKN